ncbi:TRAP transporter substrate-binding protein DctP [Azospirillum doebereinerae]
MPSFRHNLRRTLAAASLAALAGVGLAGLPAEAGAAEKWKAYTYNAVATVTPVKGMHALFETVQKETGGELSLRLYLGGTLPILATNITQAVSDGIVELGDDSFYAGNVPVGSVVRLPLFIHTFDEFEKAWDTAAPFIRAEFEKKGIVILGHYIFPSQALWSRKKLTSLQDIAGQKIRVGTPEQAEFIKLFGGTPVTLGTAEVAAALDRGVIDGVATASSGYGYVWRDLLKYSYRLPVNFVDSLLIANKDSWNKLSPQVQKAVRDAVDQQTKRITTTLAEEEDRLTKQLADGGMVVTVPTEQELAEAEARIKPYWTSWPETRGPVAKEALAKVRGVVGR